MDVEESARKFRKELYSGTTALAVLSLLVQSKEPLYGYEIGARLSSVDTDGMPMNQGALYPVLRSLEKSSLLVSHIEPSDSGPPRKYYRPTETGKAALMEWREIWIRTRDWIDSITEPKHGNRNKYASRRS